MTEQRIYFKKFDELEAMLGQKSVERPSRSRHIADRVAAVSSTLLNLTRRDETRRAKQSPQPATREEAGVTS